MKRTMDKLRIAVIFGGRSGEHEISLLSARSIISALDPNKYAITQVGIDHQGAWHIGEGVLEAMEKGRLKGLTPATLLPDPTRAGLCALTMKEGANLIECLQELDVVFPVLHGTFGEDGAIQGLFEMADLAYVGAGVTASAVGMDKAVFKDVMRANGIPVVDSITVLSKHIHADLQGVLNQVEAFSEYPYFVKPVNLGSSVGVSKCRHRSDLLEGLMEAARFDRRVLVERAINAREVEVSVLGNEDPQASLPGEIIPAADFYSYEAKYHDDRSQLLIPAPLPQTITEQLRSLAVRSFLAIDGAGMARVDFLLDRDTQQCYLSEVNTIPGFTRISMYPKLWEASGISYPELVDRLVDLALQRKAERDQIERRYERTQDGG